MKLYSIQETFSPKTGKPIGKRAVVSGIICDYTGEIVTDLPFTPIEYDVIVEGDRDYSDGSEEQDYVLEALNGEDEESEDEERENLDFWQFMVQPYWFYENWDRTSNTGALCKAWIDSIEQKVVDHPFHNCHTLRHVFHTARMLTAYRLLTEKKIKPQQIAPGGILT